jgi:[ribosomal protein S5]-alanine N-acetyltransferase
VLARSDDDFLGMVNYHERRPWHRRLTVGWILARQHWGTGLMYEAMTALLAHCFEALDTHRIEAEIEPDNHHSLRLAARLGFAGEGLLRDRACVAGEPRSILMHALLRPDWRAADRRHRLA